MSAAKVWRTGASIAVEIPSTAANANTCHSSTWFVITSVRVSADLREATVFYTVFGDEAEATSSAAALDSSKGLVRSEIGKRTGIKFTPTVEFIRDALPENVRVIDDLLQEAAIADKAVHEQAARARYAGDADPYRKSDSASE